MTCMNGLFGNFSRLTGTQNGQFCGNGDFCEPGLDALYGANHLRNNWAHGAVDGIFNNGTNIFGPQGDCGPNTYNTQNFNNYNNGYGCNNNNYGYDSGNGFGYNNYGFNNGYGY